MIPTWLTADSPVSAQGAFQNWVDAKSCFVCVISSSPRIRQDTCEFVNSPFPTVVSPLLRAPCIIHLLKAFSALRSSGQSSQAICETTARETIISYWGTGSQPHRASAVCGLGWTEWDCRPVWGPRPALCQVGRAAQPVCFCASLVLGGPSQDGQPGLSLHQCRLKYCRSGWGQFEGQRMAWCARSFISGAHCGEGWLPSLSGAQQVFGAGPLVLATLEGVAF